MCVCVCVRVSLSHRMVRAGSGGESARADVAPDEKKTTKHECPDSRFSLSEKRLPPAQQRAARRPSPMSDRVRDAMGVVGGVLLAFCLVPQLYKIHRTQSAEDIDYGWTALYSGGLAFNIAYLVLEHALVGWIFLIVELILILAVIAYKLVLEKPWRRQEAKDDSVKVEEGCT